jgi:hypothetical protein
MGQFTESNKTSGSGDAEIVFETRRVIKEWRGSREQRNEVEERRQTWRKCQDIRIQRLLWSAINDKENDSRYPDGMTMEGVEEAVRETPPVNDIWEVEGSKSFSVDNDGNSTFSPAINGIHRDNTTGRDILVAAPEKFNPRRRRGGVNAKTLKIQLQQALNTKLVDRSTAGEAEQASIDLECQEIMCQMNALSLL